MINIVIPMAGHGSRFANAGYDRPKPFIEFGGKMMIEWVVENLCPSCEHSFIFICLKEHLESFSEAQDVLNRIAPGCIIVPIERVTEGAACTILLARDFIDDENPLIVANSDQYVDCEMDEYIKELKSGVDGLIMTFNANDPKWSYCRCGESNHVLEVVEKEVISDIATVGIYGFKKGSDYVHCADEMIDENFRVKGEFYVAPVYNKLIAHHENVRTYMIPKEGEGMFGLGTPEDLEKFKESPVYKAKALAELIS